MVKQVLVSRKNKKLFFKLILISIFILLGAFYGYSNSEDYTQKIKDENERLKKIEEQIKSVKNELNDLQKKEDDYLESLHKIEKLLLETEQELQRIEKDLELTTKEIKQIEQEFILENKNLKEKTAVLESKLREIYKRNRTNYLVFILSSESFYDFFTRYRYLKDILTQDAATISDVQEQLKKTESKKLSRENREEILNILKKEVEKEKENIKTSIEAKQSIIKKINSQKTAYLKSLDELEQSSLEIKNIIENIYQRQKEVSQQTKTSQPVETPGITLKPQKGIFALPVQGKLISNYGRQKNADFNTYTFNSGIDISAPLGEVVFSAGVGDVIYTGLIKGYGQIIIIDHGGRTTTLYAHLSKILIGNGAKVKKGQIIGQVGDSGGVPSPRLHFEVRVEGKPTDPMNWL